MKFTLSHRDSQARRPGEAGHARSALLSGEELHEHIQTRSEPQTLGSRAGARDPYELWLAEQRNALRSEAEREPIRWVYRYPRVTRPDAPLLATGRGEPAGPGVLGSARAH